MSKTATCFFALGVCVAMAAACGDDDGGDGGSGGSGGSGGQGASGGAAGSGGGGGSAGGVAGQPNTAGTAGTAGTPGTAGTGGTGNAGTGGQAGAGTVDTDAGADGSVDAGPDGSLEVDASVPPDGGPSGPADSGVNGDCAGFATGVIVPQNSQDVVIARVIFNDDDETATAVLRVIVPFAFGGGQVLCWGPSNSECAIVDDDGVEGERIAGTELSVVVGTNDDPISVLDGELLLASETPENVPNVYGYLNWGGHASVDVDDTGPLTSNEALAVLAGFWTDGDSVELTGEENAFFGIGDTSLENGFDACTADQL